MIKHQKPAKGGSETLAQAPLDQTLSIQPLSRPMLSRHCLPG